MQVEMIERCEILEEMLSHAIERHVTDERIVAHEANEAVASLKAIGCPRKEAHIRVVKLVLQRRVRLFHVRLFQTFIDDPVFSIFYCYRFHQAARRCTADYR